MIFIGFESKNFFLKIPIRFLFTFGHLSKQTADWPKNVNSLEWPAWYDGHFGVHYISVSWTGTKLGLKMCFVNKQLTYVIKIFFLLERKLPSKPALSNASFGVLEVKKCCVSSELRDFFYVQTLLYAIYYRYIVKSEYKKVP